MSHKKEMNSSVASEIEQMMREAYGDNVEVGGDGVVTTTIEPRRFEDLPVDIHRDILLCLANEGDYSMPDEPVKPKAGCDKRQMSKYRNRMKKWAGGFGLKKKVMTRQVWQMRNVCEGFREAFDLDNVMSHTEKQNFPRPPIGLRISPKPPKTTHQEKDEMVKVILNIYGDTSRDNFAHCVYPSEIASMIFPSVVTTHLTIDGFVVSDGLIDTLKGFDTSVVEEVYINDITKVDLEEYTMEDLVNLFPNAMVIRFLGDASVTSLKDVFVNIPDMEIEELNDIKTGELVKLYHAVDPKFYDRNRYTRNRRVFMRELKNRKDPQEKRVGSENIITSIMRMQKRLDAAPKVRKENDEVDLSDLDLGSVSERMEL